MLVSQRVGLVCSMLVLGVVLCLSAMSAIVSLTSNRYGIQDCHLLHVCRWFGEGGQLTPGPRH